MHHDGALPTCSFLPLRLARARRAQNLAGVAASIAVHVSVAIGSQRNFAEHSRRYSPFLTLLSPAQVKFFTIQDYDIGQSATPVHTAVIDQCGTATVSEATE